MEILRRFFVVVTLIWLAIMGFVVCEEINMHGKKQFQECMSANVFNQYDKEAERNCRYASDSANLISIVKYLYARNEDSDTMRLVIWIPVGIWWGIFLAIRWIAEGAAAGKKGAGN